MALDRAKNSILLATAALLGGAAAFIQLKKSQAERQNPPEGNFIEVDGVRLHYFERGTGPTLVLLHGNLFDSRDFLLSDLLDLASAHYRLVVFDRPGFGYSERPRDRVRTAEVPERYDAYPVWLAQRPSQLRASAEEGALMIPSAFALRERLQRLAVPSMIIAGEQDAVVDTEKEAVRLHQELRGSQLRVIQGAGHMVHHIAPKAVMDAINDLARSTSEARLESSAI